MWETQSQRKRPQGMQVSSVNAVITDQKITSANVFDIDEDVVLGSVSLLTAGLNTDATVMVYLLDEDAASPTDGTILDIVTQDYLYGGYHRVMLSHNYFIPAGSRISIVQRQSKETSDGKRCYRLPYTTATNKAYMWAQNLFELDSSMHSHSWTEGRIGKGESFVNMDDKWTDWADVVEQLHEECDISNFLSYDNLGMKLYVYPADQIRELHELSAPMPFNASNLEVCSDCGYTLISQLD